MTTYEQLQQLAAAINDHTGKKNYATAWQGGNCHRIYLNDLAARLVGRKSSCFIAVQFDDLDGFESPAKLFENSRIVLPSFLKGNGRSEVIALVAQKLFEELSADFVNDEALAHGKELSEIKKRIEELDNKLYEAEKIDRYSEEVSDIEEEIEELNDNWKDLASVLGGNHE